MIELVNRINDEAKYLGNGIIKVDSFLNHQLIPDLTEQMGHEFKAQFDSEQINTPTKVITAEVSGIAPALSVSFVYNIPMVFVRKKKPITMQGKVYSEQAASHTKGGVVDLNLSSEFINQDDRVLLIDDFLATGNTLRAMIRLIRQSGAETVGIGCVIEKTYEHGRDSLLDYGIPVKSLARISLENDQIKAF